MNTRTVLVISLVIALTISACASATAGVTPTVPPAPTETPIIPTFTPIPPVQTQGVQPHKLGYHSAAYDSRADRVIVYGGAEGGVTWVYDIATNTWTNMAPGLSLGNFEGPMAYDSAADRTILFAGNNELTADYSDVPGIPLGIDSASRTWAYDYATNTWTDLQTTGGPSGLLGTRMVYDTQADRIILFGGVQVPFPLDLKNFIYPTDTWSYDFNTNTWTNMHPQTSPPGQNYFQMDYDAASDRVLAWITPDSGNGNNMWAYDFKTNTWTGQPVEIRVPYRPYGAMVYVPTVQRDFLFGGVSLDSSETPLKDMWTYDSVTNTWEQVPFTSGPSARGWHTMTYSTKSDRIVLIGGGADRNSFTNEVWIFDPHAKTWTQVGPR